MSDLYDDRRFARNCPTCHQPFLVERLDRAEAALRVAHRALNEGNSSDGQP